jgi:hypothetical protein
MLISTIAKRSTYSANSLIKAERNYCFEEMRGRHTYIPSMVVYWAVLDQSLIPPISFRPNAFRRGQIRSTNIQFG